MERNLLIIMHQSASSYKENVRHPVNAGIDATKQKQGQSVGFTGVTILGSIFDTDEAYGTSMVIAGKAQTNQGEIAIPMTGAVAWVRHGNQILEMSDLAQFTGQDSIALADGVVTNWVKALTRLGPSP
jgi:hypothetical protein